GWFEKPPTLGDGRLTWHGRKIPEKSAARLPWRAIPPIVAASPLPTGRTLLPSPVPAPPESLRERPPTMVPAFAIPVKDRRHKGRLASRLKHRCRLKRATEEGSWMATVRNITAEGIGLIANRPFKPGMTLTMELPTNPATVNKPIMVRVMHAHPQPG